MSKSYATYVKKKVNDILLFIKNKSDIRYIVNL